MQSIVEYFWKDRKRVNNLLKKADVYQYYERKGMKLSSMYTIALSNKTFFKAQRS